MWQNKNAKDGGVTMMEALNYAKLDYVSLGNHELLATALGLGSQQCPFRIAMFNYRSKVWDLPSCGKTQCHKPTILE